MQILPRQLRSCAQQGSAMMPADLTGDDVGAPPLPQLCPDHAPVIHSAARLQHVGEHDVREAAESKATQCPACYRLNGRTLL
jgi:hypothetical protein